MAEYKYEPETATDVAAKHGDSLRGEDAKAADKAGVTAAEYIDYEKALKNYEGRSDVEPLEQRRARSHGSKFEHAKFRRQGKGSGGVITSAKDENNEGTEPPKNK